MNQPSLSQIPASTTTPRLSRWQKMLLVVIVLCGAALQFYNINWDGGTLPHPDERSTVAFYAPSIHWPADLEQAFDPRQSPLNPFWDVNTGQRRSYTYGHFPLYTLTLSAAAVQSLAPVAEQLGLPADAVLFMQEARSPGGFAAVGRVLMALADTASIYLLFLLGRRLYGVRAGLLAAAFSAFTVLQIQLAHFFAVDPISAACVLLALYGSTRMADKRTVSAAVLTGVAIGLAVSSKFSALPIVAAPLVAVAWPGVRVEGVGQGVAGRQWRNLMVALGVALLVFVVTSPFVFIDFQNFWQAVIKEQGDMVSGMADLPFTRQYRGTPAYLYFLEQQVLWGMGVPLGLLSLAGSVWLVWRAIRGRAGIGEYIVLSWLVLYFGPTGLFLAKFMRYMAPVVPVLVMCGAGLVAGDASPPHLTNGAPAQRPGRPRYALLRTVAGGLALLGAVVWSLAFVNGVYGSEHTWVTASRWTYQHIPDGSCIAAEHWEEGFPQSWPEPDMNPGAHAYRQPLLPMYEEDTREKFQVIRDTLKICDYLVLASNRLWRTIPRLPERYPMSTRYYQALFDGELGFEQIYTWATLPRLGPLVIDDQAADESFTVYDHPRPIIFKKVRQLSDAEWEDLLGNLWQKAIPGYVGPPTLLMWLRGWRQVNNTLQEPAEKDLGTRKSLLLDTPVDELPVVDDFRWNELANSSTAAAVVIWWLAVQVVGWLAWPLARRLFGRLADQGYVLAKGLGWLLIGYGVWLPASLNVLPNALPTILGVVVLLAVVSGWLAWRDRRQFREILARRWRLILFGDAVFGLTYLWFIGLRVLNPDLWQPWNGGEKMLEIGFLNAIVKSAHMPPYDPYFAGGYINYYYYGLFLVSTLIKLTGIQPTIAFNLAVPTLAALTAGSVFCLAYNLAAGRHTTVLSPGEEPHPPTPSPQSGEGALPLVYKVGTGPRGDATWRPVVVGLLAVLFVIFIGNLAGFKQLVRMLGDVSGSTFPTGLPLVGDGVRAVGGLLRVVVDGIRLPTYNYWDPTRAIPDTINEFPYFSFIFADLHPHMIGMPFTVLVLSLAYVMLLGRREHPNGGDVPVGLANQSVGGRQILHDMFAFVRSPSWGSGLRWLALAFCLGALAVINTWDLPTYLGLAVFVFWLSRYRQTRGKLPGADSAGVGRWLGRPVRRLLQAVLFGVATLAACYALYLPFFAHYQPLDVGLGLVVDKTDLGQFVSIWGLFLFIGLTSMAAMAVYPQSRMRAVRALSLVLRRWSVAPRLVHVGRSAVAGRRKSAMWWAFVAVPGVAAMLWLAGYHVVGLLVPPVCLSLLLLLRPEVAPGKAFAGVLLFTALLILLGVEVFYLRDFLGGSSYYRMNTLFKFYIQAWVMLGIAGALLASDLWKRAAGWRRGRWALAWQLSLAGLIAASLVYPVLATRTRVRDRFDDPPPVGTLDGIAYMTTGTLTWPQGNAIQLVYDYEAIQWLQTHVTGTPVLAEAKIGYYREGGMRVSSYTGLPTPLGGLHQSEQRWPDQIGMRDGLYMEFWNTPDSERAWRLIEQLDISYIYIGQLERTLYDSDLTSSLMDWGVTHFAPSGFAKFDKLLSQGRLEVAYENERTRIYRVVQGKVVGAMILASALLWWLLLQLFGLVGLPLAFRLFGNLPDHGYAFARPLGLLLTGYLLWLGGSLGFWQNNVSTTLVAMCLVLGVGLWLYFSRRRRGDVSLFAWLRGHWTYVLTVELLFGLALVGWTVYKAHNPNIETAGGEKWMEIAFVNATLRSDSFPPQDPWLSGFGISYYYFGYVLMAMVTRLSGLRLTVAYNLFVPGLFALTVGGAFSLVYNLVVGRLQSRQGVPSNRPVPGSGVLYGLLGAVFVGVVGNLEGLLEVLHSRGLLPAAFWQWLDIKDINVPPLAGSWIPERFMWWWRASRVIHDCSFQGLLTGNCNPPGGDLEVIDEFPFFSFLLGDVHPHVLALPFVLLGLALALNVFFGVMRTRSGVLSPDPSTWDGSTASSGSNASGLWMQLSSGFRRLVSSVFGGWFEFFLVALCLGALGFLNTWDFPIYLGVLAAALALARARCGSRNWLGEAVAVGAGLGLLGGVLYVPFYVGFQSQVGGLLPNLFNPTRLRQFLVFFGPFLFVIVSYLIVLSRRTLTRARLRRLPVLLLVTVVGPVLAMLVLLAAAAASPSLRQMVDGLLSNPELRPLLGNATLGSLVGLVVRIRLSQPLTFLLLGGLLAWVALLWRGGEDRDLASEPGANGSADGFVLVLIGMGVLLPLLVEFVYLRDNFGIRMNTVFKFYFQAWVLMALAAAYGAFVVGMALRKWRSAVWHAGLAVLVLGGLVYPVLAVPAKTGDYEAAPTLDGMEWLRRVHPDDYEAIRWLQQNAPDAAVVLETPGSGYAAYDYIGRVSALTGLPTLLGWGNHEHQWRGSYVEPARREPDIEALYNGLDTQRAQTLLNEYGITYVYVGELERQRYSPAGLAKFETFMDIAYQQGEVTIYRRR